MERAGNIAVRFFEYFVNPLCIQLAVLFVGNVFDKVAKFFFHLFGKHNSICLF